MKDNEKYQELLNALLIKYGIKPDEDWTNDIVWKTLIDSKLDTKQRNLFYNEFTKLELKYKGMTYNSAKVSTHKIDEKLEKDGDEVKAEEVKSKDKKEEEFKECPYCAEDIKYEAIKCRHCDSFLNEEEGSELEYESEGEFQIIIKGKKKSLLTKMQKHKVLINDTYVGDIPRGEDFKYPVTNGKYEIHLKFESWKSNRLEIEVADNDILLEWGAKKIALPFSDGLWIKKT